jgi:hypothetical protein
MKTRQKGPVIAIALLTALAFFMASVAGAAPNSPELQYLQDTIKPMLDGIQSSLNNLSITLGQVWVNANAILTTVNAQPKLSVVHGKVTTTANSTTPFNLDVNSIPVQPGLIKRYTVTIVLGSGVAMQGVDSVRLAVGAWTGTGYADVTVASFDPSKQTTLVTAPYAGGNSFVQIQRGADNEGPIDVIINAYVESQP